MIWDRQGLNQGRGKVTEKNGLGGYWEIVAMKLECVMVMIYKKG